MGSFDSLKVYTEIEYCQTLSFVNKELSDIYFLYKHPIIRHSLPYSLRIVKLSASCLKFFGLMSSFIL